MDCTTNPLNPILDACKKLHSCYNLHPFFYKHEGKITPAWNMLSVLRISGCNYAYDMLNMLLKKKNIYLK